MRLKVLRVQSMGNRVGDRCNLGKEDRTVHRTKEGLIKRPDNNVEFECETKRTRKGKLRVKLSILTCKP